MAQLVLVVLQASPLVTVVEHLALVVLQHYKAVTQTAVVLVVLQTYTLVLVHQSVVQSTLLQVQAQAQMKAVTSTLQQVPVAHLMVMAVRSLSQQVMLAQQTPMVEPSNFVQAVSKVLVKMVLFESLVRQLVLVSFVWKTSLERSTLVSHLQQLSQQHTH